MLLMRFPAANFLNHAAKRNNDVPVCNFWRWVNYAFNRVDKSRVNEVGPDRAAAEWVLRCGGSVRWRNKVSFSKDYNALPTGPGDYFIEAIDGTESSIDVSGFEHFHGLKYVKEIKLYKCYYVHDDALPKLAILKNSLERLEIIYCSSVTDVGLKSLTVLTNLKFLRLYGLDGVKNLNECVAILEKALLKCKIDLNEK